MHYEEVGQAYLNLTAKPLFEILEKGDNTVDLEKENYKKYIHIRLINIVKTFKNDKFIVENNYYPVVRCTSENF